MVCAYLAGTYIVFDVLFLHKFGICLAGSIP